MPGDIFTTILEKSRGINENNFVRFDILETLLLKIRTILDVTVCRWTSGFWLPEGTLFQKVGNLTQHHIPQNSNSQIKSYVENVSAWKEYGVRKKMKANTSFMYIEGRKEWVLYRNL